MLEPLEPRRLFSVALTSTGTLAITGGEGRDEVHLRRTTAGLLVELNGVARTFPPSVAIKRVVARLGAGDDGFFAHGRMHLRARVEGGDGNDHVHAAAGNDTLLGQAGDDYLFSGEGDDSLVG